jgi:hypothetical protein
MVLPNRERLLRAGCREDAMRNGAILLLAVLCAAAGAQEKGKPRKRVGHVEFNRMVDKARLAYDTTAKRRAAIRVLCDQYEILQRAKIRDVTVGWRTDGSAYRASAALWSIDLERPWPEYGSLQIDPHDAAAVMKWGKWDRLSWVSTACLSEDTVMLSPPCRASAFRREPNPGATPPIQDAPCGESEFSGHMTKLTTTPGLSDQAAEFLATARDKAVARSDDLVLENKRESSEGEEWWEVRLKSLGVFMTRDPQLAEGLVPGAKVEIARVVRPLAPKAGESESVTYWIEPVVAKIEKPAG